MAENMVVASSIAPALTTPIVMFGGLFANSSTLPVWLAWIQYISPIYYANIAILNAQYKNQGYPYDQFLTFMGFTLSYWTCIAIMAGLALFWRILALIFLKRSVTKFQ